MSRSNYPIIAVRGEKDVGKSKFISTIVGSSYRPDKKRHDIMVSMSSGSKLPLCILEDNDSIAIADAYLYIWDMSRPETMIPVLHSRKTVPSTSMVVGNKIDLLDEYARDMYSCSTMTCEDEDGGPRDIFLFMLSSVYAMLIDDKIEKVEGAPYDDKYEKMMSLIDQMRALILEGTLDGPSF
jgi:hypothetical protein